MHGIGIFTTSFKKTFVIHPGSIDTQRHIYIYIYISVATPIKTLNYYYNDCKNLTSQMFECRALYYLYNHNFIRVLFGAH